ncbi:MAG: hypothetical protein MUC72_09225 [Acidobacteria bacterium]|jgi:hypothetical protein|nr:hypothetical protein [Acidobacteriota bacterium]
MKKLPLFLWLALTMLGGADLPDFRTSDILVLQDGFIALKIENSADSDLALPPQARDKVFLSLAINGVRRAEYKVKAMDPTIFLRRSFIVFKTNFRSGQPMRIRIELNSEKAVPETDFSNNILEKDLLPPL